MSFIEHQSISSTDGAFLTTVLQTPWYVSVRTPVRECRDKPPRRESECPRDRVPIESGWQSV